MQLLALATRQVEMGNTVTVIPIKGQSYLASRFHGAGVKVNLSIVNGNTIRQYFWLRRFLAQTDFDILHAHLPRAQILAACTNRIINRLQISRHDAMPFIAKFPGWLSKLIWKFVRLRSKTTIAISDAIRKKMLERGEIERETDVKVIHYGIPTSFQALSSAQAELWPMQDLSTRENVFVFGTVSRLVREKNLQMLIKAFSLVKKQIVTSILVIVGYGPLKEELQTLAKDLNVVDYVYFLGRQDNVFEMLTHMDSFILPSKTEGFGLVLIEAMSASLPIIASEVDAIPEVLGQKCGLLFDPEDLDELVRLMILTTDPKVNQTLRIASANRAKKFSIEKSERKIMKEYQDSVGKGIPR